MFGTFRNPAEQLHRRKRTAEAGRLPQGLGFVLQLPGKGTSAAPLCTNAHPQTLHGEPKQWAWLPWVVVGFDRTQSNFGKF